MELPEKFLATTTPLSGGLCRCDECGEVMLEDERHWHDTSGGDTPDPAPLTRTRFVEITEQWVRACDEFPGCHAADPSKPCCGDGHWEKIEEHNTQERNG